MSISIEFDRERARSFVDALNNGTALKAPEGGWSESDLLGLAGACFCLATAQGPPGLDENDEDEEAWTRFFDEMHAAVEWCADRTLDVVAGEYDQQFEPRHTAVLSIEDDTLNIHPESGFKNTPQE
ncbi:MAG: hypothetical protein IPM64_03610 [Phycisphaerales bacterium]|nr:hypothetical protein [Phycisphaerales bacterium]